MYMMKETKGRDVIEKCFRFMKRESELNKMYA